MNERKFDYLRETQEKIKESLKDILAKILRAKDVLRKELDSITGDIACGISARDIPEDFLDRDVIDLGSGAGYRYREIKNLFKIKDYMGIDIDPDEVKAGRRRKLDIRQLDFVDDEDIRGDLGVIIGSATNPEVIQRLGERFNRVFFTEGAMGDSEAQRQEIVRKYKAILGDQNISFLERRTSLLVGKKLYGFYRPKTKTEDRD